MAGFLRPSTDLLYSLWIACCLAALLFTPCNGFFPSSFSSLSNVSDEAALLSFKSHIVHDPFHALSNWNTNASFCDWNGVRCSRSRQRVVALNLNDMSLEGTFSPDVANLSFLHVLSFSNNSLHGDLLSIDFHRLFRLRALHLSRNRLQGSIPQSLSRCRHLQSLILSYNDFSGTVPSWVGSLPDLRVLDLGTNPFHGSIIPISLSNASSLNLLDLSDANLEGTIPNALGALSKLVRMTLSENKLVGAIPSGIFNISSLKIIELANNSLTGQLPPKLGVSLPNLEQLTLHINSLSGQIPAYLSNASKLQVIEFSQNGFSGPIPVELGNLPLIQEIYLNQNQLTNTPNTTELSFITALTKCRHLRALLVAGNSLNGMLPASIGNLSTNLQYLILAMNQIHGRVPLEICNITSLMYLSLDENNLNGVLPENMEQLSNLQRLAFSSNNLEGFLPPQIYQMRVLGELRVDHNMLSGPISSSIQNLSNLVELHLSDNNLSSFIPSSLWGLKDLRIVDLSHNSFNGSLRLEVGSMAVLSYLDLSANQLSGNLPSTLSQLQMLEYLNLSLNSFQGVIPDTLDNLLSIVHLDISHNSLSGTIPKSLASLKYLQELNLSFNLLEGEIPNYGRFANLSADSFEGNQALCGAPRFQVPMCPTNSRTSKTKRVILSATSAGAVLFLILCITTLTLRCKKKMPGHIAADESPRIRHRMISYIELQRATDNFSESNLIGIGSFGSVYKGRLSDGMIVAVKLLNMDVEAASKSFEVECRVLQTARHRNLVEIITSSSNLDFKSLVLEYMPNGNLHTWLFQSDHGSLDLLQWLDIMIDVACAVEYMHHDHPEPIVHCDLKPSNVLLDDDMAAHVADFGIARLLVGNKTSTQATTLGTVGYTAPEIGLAGKVSIKADVYSYGILLLETFTRKKPTDAMFTGDFSLRQWVSEAFPHAIPTVVDGFLLLTEGIKGSNVDGRSRNEAPFNIHGVLVSVIEVGLLCSRESPDERMNMREVVATLKKIRTKIGC